jgi:hypothetical protein
MEARSTMCLSYDVVLKTSYNGFLSDPFYMFINAPNNTVATNCPFTEGCPANTWNWTRALGNGGQSWIYYATDTLCAMDGPMSAYDMNESFGTWSGSKWNPPSPEGWLVSGTVWKDKLSFYCPAGDCVPMPQNPPSGCWPNCGSVKVQSAPQTFKVGTENVGQGIAVQADTHQRWLDHGSHEQIVIPIPQ